MEYGYATSIWRYQGSTVKEPYLIYESMKRDMMYVALSRGVSIDCLYFKDDKIEATENKYDEKRIIEFKEKDHLKKAFAIRAVGDNGKSKIGVIKEMKGINKDCNKWLKMQKDLMDAVKDGVNFEIEVLDDNLLFDNDDDLMVMKCELIQEYEGRCELYNKTNNQKFIKITQNVIEAEEIEVYKETEIKNAVIQEYTHRGKKRWRIRYYENSGRIEKSFKTQEEAIKAFKEMNL
jgi:hypothetical protein